MKTSLILVTFILLISASYSFAYQITFQDNHNYWPTWANQTKDNTKDVIGNPNITGGTAVINGGKLQSVTFNYTASNWNMLYAGDLFLNILKNGASDSTWDYVVDTYYRGHTPINSGSGEYGLYSVSIDERKNNSVGSYILSGQDGKGQWRGYDIRDNHPVAVPVCRGSSKKVKYGITNDGNIYHATFDFSLLSGGGIDLSGYDLIIGWETTCANDVVYERIHIPAPEPGTILLLGGGLLGLGFYGRRRLKV